jgi:hypothetical protein
MTGAGEKRGNGGCDTRVMRRDTSLVACFNWCIIENENEREWEAIARQQSIKESLPH